MPYNQFVGDHSKSSNSGSKMINTSYEDNFTFLRMQQQQQTKVENRERLRASPAIQSHHASATSLSSEESAFLVPRPKPSTPRDAKKDSNSSHSSIVTSQPITR